MNVAVKRVYEPVARQDGVRVLVDRLWPRGLTKDEAALTAWLRDLAPSHELRRWYHARPEQYASFRKKYLAELADPKAELALQALYRLSEGRKRITLLFASKNLTQNNATVLKDLLEGMPKPPTGAGAARAAGRRQAARRR